MGVSIELRSVMHWQQSARFLGPSRDCSPLLNTFCGIGSSSGNNNHSTQQACSSCSDQPCEHSTKSRGLSPIYNEPCTRRYRCSEGVYEDSLQFSDNNIENKDEIKSTCIQLKSEPQVSSSPELEKSCRSEDCAGCGKPIQDRFYLSAVEKRWHEDCLKCCVCTQALERASSCFSKEGNIYCKSDYCRIFGTRRCSKCLATISSSELVMRARHLVFHVKCFSCAICHLPLAKGDHYGIKDAAVLCRLHFETAMDQSSLSFSCQYPTQFGSPLNAPSSPKETNIKLTPVPYFSQHDLQVFPHQPRQKGRPRKRKPKDIEAMTANLDLNTDYLDMGFGRGSLSAAARAKRMRTSFKHHQLRTMKSYFAINHNPDAKDLKQLSQKTGLPKRVLQVWFQNARAKWRRMIMKQEGKSIECDKGESSLDLDSYGPPSPSFMCGPDSPSILD